MSTPVFDSFNCGTGGAGTDTISMGGGMPTISFDSLNQCTVGAIGALGSSTGTFQPGGLTGPSQGVIPGLNLNGNYIDDFGSYVTKAITGQMYTAEVVLSENEIEQMKQNHGNEGFKYEVKKMLVQQMVEKIHKEGKFDFGMQHNYTEFSYTFRARIFVTPNDQTQIIKATLDKQT
jgi:hypothetical protein